jgi:hypothetical protein
MQPSLDSESSGLMPSSSGSPPSPEHMLLGEGDGNPPFSPSVIWFCSPEANALSQPKCEEENALQAIRNQIKLLRTANESPEGFLDLLSEKGEEEEELLDGLSEIGLTTVKNLQTVELQYRKFCLMCNFTIGSLPGKHNLPPLLQENRDVSLKIQAYTRENLLELSVELIMEYLHNTIIPNLVKQSTGVGPEEEAYVSIKKELFEQYGLKKLCISTVYRWMRALGFKFEVHKKGFYVDGHEKPATLHYRKKFISWYMNYERCMHRWIQLTKKRARH